MQLRGQLSAHALNICFDGTFRVDFTGLARLAQKIFVRLGHFSGFGVLFRSQGKLPNRMVARAVLTETAFNERDSLNLETFEMILDLQLGNRLAIGASRKSYTALERLFIRLNFEFSAAVLDGFSEVLEFSRRFESQPQPLGLLLGGCAADLVHRQLDRRSLPRELFELATELLALADGKFAEISDRQKELQRRHPTDVLRELLSPNLSGFDQLISGKSR